MSITANSTIAASDFVSTSAGAGDTGKVPKLGSDGQVDITFVRKHLKFGGTGADGALAISSGTTTINCSGAALVVKNYTSISITGTGKLAFSNPHDNGTTIVLKSQGDITLTSSTAPMIDCSKLGGKGGTGGTATSSSQTVNGGGGSSGISFSYYALSGGNSGIALAGTAAGGTKAAFSALNTTSELMSKYPIAIPGAGGGGGCAKRASAGTGDSTIGGNGGRGGGALIIECAGAWNFTTTNGISVAGETGTVGSAPAGTGSRGAGGGGGGGGGFFLALYNSLTANSGTVNVSLGSGVAGDGAETASGGGGGASVFTDGSSTSSSTGANGAAGVSTVRSNTEFA